MKTNKEQHLVGKHITVVYTIKDPTEWRKTNPLHYAHNGLEACCVSIGDRVAQHDKLRIALEEIEREGDNHSRIMAAYALSCDDIGMEDDTND